MGAAQPMELFVSYSHHDDAWRRQLFPAVVRTTLGDCPVWSDARLRAGDDWAAEIDLRLARCRVAVLLASPNFLASRFIRDRELPRILQRARDDALRIVWLPIALEFRQLEDRLPTLASLQAAIPVAQQPGEALPLDAGSCGSSRLDEVRAALLSAIRRTLDPVGVELDGLLRPRYRIESRISEGNRAYVYRARDEALERGVAVKVLKDPLPQLRDEFMDDVKRGIRLSEEPNFINLYDCAPTSSIAYCVQQLVDGDTLRKRLDGRSPERPLPLARFLHVFHRLARALARAHDLDISYGNLKPSNIILDQQDEPFVLPVGRRRDRPQDAARLAALLQRAADAASGGAALSPADADDLAYLVPEQFGEDVDAIDARLADQYMLGLMGWEMVTGRRPDAVRDVQHLPELGRCAFDELDPPSRYRPLLPRRVEALLARMTERRPRDRFPEMATVVRELEAMPDIGLLIVLDSWRRILDSPDAGQRVMRAFYERFLQLAPAARAHFAHLEAAGWERQHAMMKDAVMLLLAFRQQGSPDEEPNLLSPLARRHRHVDPRLYGPFVDALLVTFLGDPAQGVEPADPLCRSPLERDALDEHWREALEPGVAWLAARSGR